MSCWLKMFIMSTMINVVVKKEWKYIIFISVFLLHIHLINVRPLLYRKSRHTTWQTRYFAVSHQTRLLRSSCRLTVIHSLFFSSVLLLFVFAVVLAWEHTHTHFIHSTFTPNEGNQIVCLFGQEMSKCCVGMLAGERDRERRTKKTDAADDNQGVSGARRSVSRLVRGLIPSVHGETLHSRASSLWTGMGGMS